MLKDQNPNPQEVHSFFRWVNEQIRKSNPEDVSIGLMAAMTLLRRPDYRTIFKTEDGIQQVGGLLKNPRATAQAYYQAVYCLWLLSFNSEIATSFPDTLIISRLVDLLKTQQAKEKILRIVLATLRNLLDKGTSNTQMIDAGIIRLLDQFSVRRWGDEDMVADIDALRVTLAKDLVIMSSFDAYKKEVLSGNLEWSPVHKSEKFWKENVTRFEENQYQVLKALITILQTASDPSNIAVACYDVGEFARFHPRGRALLQSLNAKTSVMDKLSHPDPTVQKEALLAVQKLMVNNWEYLNR